MAQKCLAAGDRSSGSLRSPSTSRRDLALVVEELGLRRRERDRHLADGRLRMAGECCAEIEQLEQEHVSLRAAQVPSRP